MFNLSFLCRLDGKHRSATALLVCVKNDNCFLFFAHFHNTEGKSSTQKIRRFVYADLPIDNALRMSVSGKIGRK